ncbi:hypothetical protein [Bacillus sp. FJAT-44742]|uniref:hypothetical protein n=1 Tax=Bacillus sp. FJAT-44742 TaxID=2014005 RepID=UPI000C2383E9|nr:hypothetical protein [Bacillus sp. FJAT-44742]
MKQMTIQINKRSSEETIEKFQKEMLALEGVDRTLVEVEEGEIRIEYDEGKADPAELLRRIQQYDHDVL